MDPKTRVNKRIQGHIMVPFPALVLQMTLRRKLGVITEEAPGVDSSISTRTMGHPLFPQARLGKALL